MKYRILLMGNTVEIAGGLHEWLEHTQKLYILTSVWVLRTPNAGWNIHFQGFFVQKGLNKQQICS